MTTKSTQYALFEMAETIPLERPAAQSTPGRFSDYVVYVDESGDHSLASINPDFPVFVLALCVIHKRHYAEKIIPAVEKLKFNYFGHDSVVLHEHDIRKQKGDFAFLSHLPTRLEFVGQLSSIMDASNFILIACVVDKARMSKSEGASTNPYHIALDICLECLRGFLAEKKRTTCKPMWWWSAKARRKTASWSWSFGGFATVTTQAIGNCHSTLCLPIKKLIWPDCSLLTW
jgi:hypothetical protein